MQIAFSLSLTLLRAILVKIRRSNIKRSWPRYLTDLAEILHVVLLWGPNYEMGVSKLSPGKFYFGRSERQYGGSKDILSSFRPVHHDLFPIKGSLEQPHGVN